MSWQDLKIYRNPSWYVPKVKGGVVTKEGHFERFVYSHMAYALSARQLIEGGKLQWCCLPIAYMQRHSLELASKSLTAMVYSIEAARESTKCLNYVSPRDPKFTHTFSEVLDEARDALGREGETLPKEFQDLADLFDAFDGGKPDRLRYDRVKQGQSFPKDVQVDLVGRQEALEALLEEHVLFDLEDVTEACAGVGGPWNLKTRLFVVLNGEALAVTEALYQAGK